jgi:uncharacterized protein YkwD
MQAGKRPDEQGSMRWPAQRLLRALQIDGGAAAEAGADRELGRGAPPVPAWEREGDDSNGLSRPEERLLKLINMGRLKADLASLAADPRLQLAARRRAETVSRSGAFGCDPHGTTFFDLLHSVGIRFRWAGESLVRNTCSDRWSVILAAADLMGSTRHRENVMAEFFNRAGVGMATAGDGTKYFAVLFTD